MMSLTKDRTFRPRMIFAYVDSEHAARCGRYFRRLGWEVHLVASAEEARRLAAASGVDVIVLDVDLPDESGWLTCAKMTRENPTLPIILLAPDRSPETVRHLADVNAAALISRHDTLDVLAGTILCHRLAETV